MPLLKKQPFRRQQPPKDLRKVLKFADVIKLGAVSLTLGLVGLKLGLVLLCNFIKFRLKTSVTLLPSGYLRFQFMNSIMDDVCISLDIELDYYC